MNIVKQTPSYPILKSVLKYDKHPSVTAVRNQNIRPHSEFSFVGVDEVSKKIKKLNPLKAALSADFSEKILKECYVHICSLYLWIF